MKLFSRSLIISLLFLIILGINFLGVGVNFYTDVLWFKNLNFIDSFWTIFQAKVVVRLGVWLLFSLFIYFNLLFTKKLLIKLIENLKRSDKPDDHVIELNPKKEIKFLGFLSSKRINLIYLLISIVVGFFFSSIGANSWKMVLEFLNASSFGSTDPIFNKDISFYIFKFPFYQFIYQLLSTLVIITGLIVGSFYLLNNRNSGFFNRINNQGKYHLSILISLFFLLKAWGYRLDMFQLLYSSRGVAFGASYTDIHAQLFGLKALSLITIVLAIFIFINIFIKKTKLIIGGIVTLFIASLLLNTIYPGIVQQYQVEPNEIAKEAPYIEHNIKFTREAYNLDEIEKRDFDIKDDLTYDDIIDNEVTISNIRLWDNRPLKTTYGQIQGIRSYYSFNDIDIDRYQINDKTQQVMLGARELNQKLLSNRAKTWVNKRLNYTHGFGLAMSPVNRVSPGGLPEFLIKDIPPESKEFEIKQPRIYYGELTDEYVIVNTSAKEFDYPEGDKNNYIRYNGDGGVKLSSPIRRLAFAAKYATLKLLLNDNISSESRLMFNRNIKTRVAKIAPFLKYDNDPYLVINNSGELYWIHDAYTTSNRYPYSEPQNWGNYIRNSVKVITNAYTGKVKFYVVDNSDPIIRTYQKIFPKLFSKFEEMPADLKAHIRYPEDLFKIQADLYSIYHMEDPTVFYNKEDLWNTSQENYAGTAIEMEPYYTLIKLPDEEEESFLLMLPFTPIKKNNMISWLAAKSDHDDYGKLVLYKFPKRELVYGPMQIEARIDQNSEISKQLSLWNQRGSRVIRGNLLTIPIKNSILYVEPIYLQAEQSQLPELKKVIVSYGENVIMEDNLKLALQRLFRVNEENRVEDKKEEATPIVDDENLSVKGLVNEISELYNSSKEALKAGNWTEYGKLIEELEDKLNLLQDKTEK
ncbi:hypothetical protein U472_10600 [Orenia metallireducens]|uniref:UPF0182 protein U472_10600 n=1 Tax=Orenia metallireducens TaxID=1413210 RepID=A0A1C0A887_9FIRM|nr:UPF0182 family protein [Orenia metallireducens]OCL26442.1 hypothetical protein U472_10600 [Orenia metallireducens]